jgi:hypothetical protein
VRRKCDPPPARSRAARGARPNAPNSLPSTARRLRWAPELRLELSYGCNSALLELSRSAPIWIDAERIDDGSDSAASVVPWLAVAIV